MTHKMRHPPRLADENERLRALRSVIAARIEADIAFLDALDGDPDLETTASERHGGGFVLAPMLDDSEDGHDAEAVNEDGESRPVWIEELAA